MKYSIEIINSREAWKSLAEDWNTLLENSAADTIFLTWEWLYSWAECYLTGTRQLFLLAVYKDRDLVGIAPWYINHTNYMLLKMRRIEFLGSPEAGSDYLDIIARRGKERDVATALYQFLLNEGSQHWDCLQLMDIPATSLFLLHFLNNIEEDGKYIETGQGSYCPIATLKPSQGDFLATLTANRREQFRRHSRLLEKCPGVEFHSFILQDDETPLNDWCTLFKDKNQYFNEPLDRFVRSFASRCADKGWLQLDLLTSQGRAVAGLLHLQYRNQRSMYLMTVDKSFEPKISVGTVLVGKAIQNSAELGLCDYDFLKGPESYKFHWANAGRRSMNVYFAQRRPSTVLLSIMKLIKGSAKLLLR